ncbi:MAG TPA: type II 3-dehydroquinate dehydratase [Clostridia bacterium]|nr:type II 3-dehydroquinate dehydratase [Clostridia bacterium]
MKILVINGPNINMLGIREKNIYGSKTYDDLLEFTKSVCERNSVDVEFFQSNCEGEIVTAIQKAYRQIDGIVINAAAYTHTSVAILDALKAVSIPCVEVHISDIDGREEFRRHSYIALVCEKRFIGFGFDGYKYAVEYLKEKINENRA